LGISKRGDAYLRTLLMHGARAVVRSDRATTWEWLAGLLKRRPYSVAVAAVANKMARTIWAVLARGRPGNQPHGRLPDALRRVTGNDWRASDAKRVMGQTGRTGTRTLRVGNLSLELGVQMGVSSADAIRASRLASLHNRPDIRLQPSLLLHHANSSLRSGRRPYKTFPRAELAGTRRPCCDIAVRLRLLQLALRRPRLTAPHTSKHPFYAATSFLSGMYSAPTRGIEG